MVLVEIKSNVILVEPRKDRTAGEMIRAYEEMVLRLKACSIEPTEHVLDNECSEDFKQAIENNGMTYQLVPPHDHQRNIAEKAIQTFKDHCVVVFYGAT